MWVENRAVQRVSLIKIYFYLFLLLVAQLALRL